MCRTVGGAAARPEDKCNKLHILAHSRSPVFCTTECPFLFYWTLVLHQHFSSTKSEEMSFGWPDIIVKMILCVNLFEGALCPGILFEKFFCRCVWSLLKQYGSLSHLDSGHFRVKNNWDFLLISLPCWMYGRSVAGGCCLASQWVRCIISIECECMTNQC